MNLEQARQIVEATEWKGSWDECFRDMTKAAKCLLREHDDLQHRCASNAADLKRFAILVAEMRHVQADYFRLRSPSVLQRSKVLERQVDAVCREVLDSDKQGTLFG